MMTDDEFEEEFKRIQEIQDREQHEFEALSDDEKQRRLGGYDPGFLERISGGMGLCESDE